MQKIIQQYQDHIVDDSTQKRLNEPLKDKTGFNKGHEEFLKDLIKKLQDGTLDPHAPATLYNHKVYDRLQEKDQEATDLTAINLMSLIRQIENLWKLDKKPTFQIQNLVESVFQMKSQFEEKHGDVYII
ncbi:hypothetical protein KJ742_07385 [Patescibacteria group bacterium]|nr:hypothetical protein [Patescibacteria group bacterium]MBU1683733.1 hypothetical protein [Patescibacteria group bacterium]MBU1934576.1 hypothetical protein [Patescibacteria group bacterium]